MAVSFAQRAIRTAAPVERFDTPGGVLLEILAALAHLQEHAIIPVWRHRVSLSIRSSAHISEREILFIKRNELRFYDANCGPR